MRHPNLFRYYTLYCKASFLNGFNSLETKKVCILIENDEIAYYLFLLFLSETKKGNAMNAFAYFKNFFDRVTADIDFACNSHNKRCPHYNKFYKEKSIKEFYASVSGSDEVVTRAHKLRNSNPVSHSSAELLANNDSTKELYVCVKDLLKILKEYVKTNIH